MISTEGQAGRCAAGMGLRLKYGFPRLRLMPEVQRPTPMDSRRLAIINTYLTIALIALTIVLIVLTIVLARDVRRLDVLTHSLIGQPSTPPPEQSPTPTPTSPILKAIPIPTATPTPNLTPSPSPEPARAHHRHLRRHR